MAAMRAAEAPPWVLSEAEAAEAEAARRERRRAKHAGEPGCRVFVGNLPASVREDALWELFGECGYIAEVRLATEREGWLGLGLGFALTPTLTLTRCGWRPTARAGAAASRTSTSRTPRAPRRRCASRARCWRRTASVSSARATRWTRGMT